MARPSRGVSPRRATRFADEFERQGLDPAQSSLRIGMFGAEPWSEAMHGEIERRMGIYALDHYGLSELMGPGVAQEWVETKDGLTIWEDHFYPEIMDPKSGASLADGKPGELVLFYIMCEAEGSFHAISASHDGGRDLGGVADFSNGRRREKFSATLRIPT
jgi:phenylacetate-CoA ligase